MIAALALALLRQDTSHVIELIESTATTVSVEAVVKLPPLTPHERAEAILLAESMPADVDGYSRSTMRDIAARAGDQVRVTLMPDHLRIHVGVVPGDLKLGIAIVDQILRNSRLPADPMNKAITELPFRTRGIWATALQPFKYDFAHVRREGVQALYQRICRPENVWLAVGGPIRAGEAEDIWRERTENWALGRAPRAESDDKPLDEVADVPGRESIIELRGPEIPGRDAAISIRLLALIGLGSGKGSAIFERIREKQGWSYRQEGLLWPTVGGFAPRFIVASGADVPPRDLAKGMKEELLDAVDHWTEADLARACGMAEGIFTRGFEMSPLYFNPWWPIGDSLSDRTFLAAYWSMKTGHVWESKRILGEMALVSLDELKEAARNMLGVAIPHILPARK